MAKLASAENHVIEVVILQVACKYTANIHDIGCSACKCRTSTVVCFTHERCDVNQFFA